MRQPNAPLAATGRLRWSPAKWGSFAGSCRSMSTAAQGAAESCAKTPMTKYFDLTATQFIGPGSTRCSPMSGLRKGIACGSFPTPFTTSAKSRALSALSASLFRIPWPRSTSRSPPVAGSPLTSPRRSTW